MNLIGYLIPWEGIVFFVTTSRYLHAICASTLGVYGGKCHVEIFCQQNHKLLILKGKRAGRTSIHVRCAEIQTASRNMKHNASTQIKPITADTGNTVKSLPRTLFIV